MGAYDSVGDLLSVLDGHAARMLDQEDLLVLIGLPRFLEFLELQPLLSSAIGDLSVSVADRDKQFCINDAELVEDIRSLWGDYGPRFLEAERSAESAGKIEIFQARGRTAGFSSKLSSPCSISDLEQAEIGQDPSVSGQLVASLEHWVHWIEPENAPDRRALAQRIEDLAARHTHHCRRFWLERRNLAGLAFQRLRVVAGEINPPPAEGADLTQRWARKMAEDKTRDVVRAIFDPWSGSTADQSAAVKAAAHAVRRDVAVLCLELRSILLLRRSHLGLVKRFAARCERYDAAELRGLCATESPEAALTLRFARFLFDAGMNPLVDPKIAELRPDVVDLELGHPIYVEAKQYDNDNPSGALKKAIGQVADTWGRLRTTHPLSEAFLLVFRRKGPRVEMPEIVLTEGRTLHTTLVDIGAAEDSGSRQTARPLVIRKQDVLDWISSDPTS